MSSSYYETAQICMNGHVVTSRLNSYPVHSQKFCDKCGAVTIQTCQNCNSAIRGDYVVPGYIGIGDSYIVPSFCHNCGKPYPWIATRLKAARELSDELDGLNPSEREQLKKSLDDIVTDTPQTAVAALKFKRLVAKAGIAAAGVLKDILVDIVSETAKKLIWPT